MAHARGHGGSYYIWDLSDLASLSLDFLANRMQAVDASDEDLHIVTCIDMIHWSLEGVPWWRVTT